MSGTVMLSTDGMRRTKVMTKIVKEVGNMKDHTHQKGKSSHGECASGHDHGGVSKHGRSAEPGGSLGHPRSKER